MLETALDEIHMRRALRLAALGRHASPNPMVGCVLVGEDGRVVAEGYHVRPGTGHAEAVALGRAGERARGATAYVTLEPCSHHARTPPCADALIRAGVGRVVAAVLDPDERVSGSGVARLEAAGIPVTVGVCRDAALLLNAAYIKHRTTGLPYVILKTAMTLDGRIATASGDSRWITSPVTRLWVHRRLRDRCDAVVVGVGTVLSDDPALTTRLAHREGRNPLRVVVDTHLRTPPAAAVVREGLADGLTLIACGEGADPARRAEMEAAGAVVFELPLDAAGRVDLRALLAELGGSRGLTSVVIEGGSELAAGFLSAGLVDEYITCIAPKVIGGAGAPGPVGGAGLSALMSGALTLEEVTVRRSGPDVIVRGRVAAEKNRP